MSFTSHIDGTLYRFTPERSVEIQHALGADIFFVFDECTSPEADYNYQKEAAERTHRWAERSLGESRKQPRGTEEASTVWHCAGWAVHRLEKVECRDSIKDEF